MSFLDFLGGEDVVAIYASGTGGQLFESARPMRVSVRPSSQVMAHPIEQGALRADHVVINPTELDLTVMLDPLRGRDIFRTLDEARRAGLAITVMTRTAMHEDLIITALPYDELPNLSDSVPMTVRLSEVITFAAQFEALPPEKVANKTDSSTRNRGELPTTATPSGEGSRRTSNAAKIYGAFGGS